MSIYHIFPFGSCYDLGVLCLGSHSRAFRLETRATCILAVLIRLLVGLRGPNIQSPVALRGKKGGPRCGKY